jgi:hypothetical protein
MKGVEMDGACSTRGRDEKCILFGLENLKGRDSAEDLNIDGNIILEWILTA